MSMIEREFNETDQNYYFVPCPHCGEMQRLEFANLIWEEGKPETAQYYCIHCGAGIEEYQKVTMFADGEWRPAVPELSNNETIGFHLNSLYSPFGWQSWAEIASDFIKSKESPNKLKVFVNTTLGETWAEKGEAPPFMNIYNRREKYKTNKVPTDVCFLTAGVDIQRDRIELEIVGWCADKRSYSIDYRVLEGDTAAAPVWNQLAKVVDEHWTRRDGVEMPIKLMAIDSGFNTTQVYNFCRRFDASRVIPTKGQDKQAIPVERSKSVDRTKAGKQIGKLKQWNVGVSLLKSELYGYLRLEKDEKGIPPPCYCHFPEYGEHYFRGLTAEEQVTKIIKGYQKTYWQKVYERNEPLDCRIYARAASIIVGLDRFPAEKLKAMAGTSTPAKSHRTTESGGESDAPQTHERKRRRSEFWDR